MRAAPPVRNALALQPYAMHFNLPAGTAPNSGRTSAPSSGLIAHDQITREVQVPTECYTAQHDRLYVGNRCIKSNATFRRRMHRLSVQVERLPDWSGRTS